MKLILQTPKRTLNKAFLKQRSLRSEIDLFKTNLLRLLGKIDEIEKEENQKNHVRDFLRDTFYKETNEINTKDSKDLVIHLGKTNKDKVGVIIEAKRPSNKAEMMAAAKPNAKALQELVLYYLRERIEENNIDIKYCIATNIYEWFIIDAAYFEKLFYGNKAFVKEYQQWRDGKKVTKDTSLFYNDIAKPFIDSIETEIPCTYFDIRNYEKVLRTKEKDDDKNLIALLKILSPNHLLRVPFADDSNKLDENFYKELLYLIGLEETKEGSKYILRRKKENRNEATLLEQAIGELNTVGLHKVSGLNNYGETNEERSFNISLELCITWINRILFLKLLEGQLINYHKGDKDFRFLNSDKINDFDELYTLFHKVLAVKQEERTDAIKKKYLLIPYLNSSLFEISELEEQTVKINSLNSSLKTALISSTVLKEQKKKSDKLPTLDYLFKFLDAYDFSSEGTEDIQEDVSKQLINASVLGKVYEKINGYKDGSIFTPGFITMYMCRKTIRLAVMQKFKEKYGWKIKQFDDLKNYLADKKTSKDILIHNKLINSLHLCDPAVGSGHFFVSSLNEIIAIKFELGLFADESGIRFTDYDVAIENDELIVTNSNGDIFEYKIQNEKPQSKEAQRLQKTLFHEKQTIIENCLFGVDINPNSVKICRLRLWIELLKNAYYKPSVTLSGAEVFNELETLPNIDINIKCGNSLLSRFSLNDNLTDAFRKQQFTLATYKAAITTYQNSTDRKEKRELTDLIAKIKSEYTKVIGQKDPLKRKVSDLRGEIILAKSNLDLFGKKMSDEDAEWEVKRLTYSLEKAIKALEERESGKIYYNAFEWRFEFPEVLNDNGDFEGFDVLIENPPYVYRNYEYEGLKKYFISNYSSTEGNFDLYRFFIEKTILLTKQDCYCSLIVPNTFLTAKTYSKLRKFILNNSMVLEIFDLGENIFDGITVENVILRLQRKNAKSEKTIIKIQRNREKSFQELESEYILNLQEIFDLENSFNIYLNPLTNSFVKKIRVNTIQLSKISYCTVGINTGYIKDELTAKTKIDETYHKMLSGRDIGINSCSWKGEWIKYDKEFVDSFKEKGRSLPPEYIFTKEKILVQRTRRGLKRKLVCYYDKEKYYNLNRLSNIVSIDKDFSLKYVHAILNSSLMDYYFNVVFNEYEVKPVHLAELPIKKISPKGQKPFVDLVDQILEARKENSETKTLENEIDKLVYELYEITPAEQKIIES